jgi:hypothetical protein
MACDFKNCIFAKFKEVTQFGKNKNRLKTIFLHAMPCQAKPFYASVDARVGWF